MTAPKATEAIRLAVVSLVHEIGTRESAEVLGMSVTTVLRVIAGQGVREGTLAQLREKLKSIAPPTVPPKPPGGGLSATIGERVIRRGRP